MLNPSSGTLADYNNAILNSNATHARIVFPVQNKTFTDDDIAADGGITLTQIVNPDTDMVMGKAVSSEIVIRFLNNGQFTGFNWTEEFRVDFGVDISGTTNWVTVGYFTGKKPERVARQEIIEFTAMDRMQKFDVLADEFIDGLTFPKTLTQIYSALCSYIGISSKTGNGIATAMTVSFDENPIPKGVSCRTILAWIAELNCCYARITNDGYVRVTWFSDQSNSYILDGDHYFAINIDEANVKVIDSVRIASSDTSISGYIYPISGYSETYTILDNPFLLNMPASPRTVVQSTIISRFSAIGAYTPASLNTIGNWMVETGDIIQVIYDGNQTMNLPIFHRVLHWNGGCEDGYECTGATERTSMSATAKEQYDIGAKLASKYTIQSGVDITDEGVTVSGGKYVKIESGGVFDVSSDNLDIDSIGGYLITKRKLNNQDYWMAFGTGVSGVPMSGSMVLSNNGITIENNNTTQVGQGGLQYNSRLDIGLVDFNVPGRGVVTYPGITSFAYTFDPITDERTEFPYGNAKFGILEAIYYVYTTQLIAEDIAGGCVANNLTTTSPYKVLDARQGKELNDTKLNKTSVYNDLDKTASGFALDARQGKVLNDEINSHFAQTLGSTSSPITSLNSIPVNTTGYVTLDSTIHPAAVTARLNYFCFGTNTYRMLYLMSDATGRIWTNVRKSSGTWNGFLEISNIEDAYKNFLSYSSTTIPANSDFDNYNTPGVYTVANAATSATIAHCPFTSSGGRLEVMGQNSNTLYQRQMYYPAGSANIYTRIKGASVWGSWYRLNITAV